MKKTPAVIVKQPEPPAEQISTEVLATAIANISEAFEKVRTGPLSQRALVLLIQDACVPKVSQQDIARVLSVLPQLKSLYVRRTP